MSFNKTWNARKKFPASWSGNSWEPFDQLPVNIAHYGDNCYGVPPIIINLHLNNTLRGESIFKSKNFRGGGQNPFIKWRCIIIGGAT